MLEPSGTTFAASTAHHTHPRESVKLSPLPSKSAIASTETKISSKRQTNSSLVLSDDASGWAQDAYPGEADTDSVAARRPKIFVKTETVQTRDPW